MEHSAEWLRGAYQFASRYAPMDVAMQINVLLAAAEAREAGEHSAAEVIRVAKAALKPFGDGAVMSRIGRKDYSAMRERIVDWHGPSDFRAAKKALATISAWEAGNVQG